MRDRDFRYASAGNGVAPVFRLRLSALLITEYRRSAYGGLITDNCLAVSDALTLAPESDA